MYPTCLKYCSKGKLEYVCLIEIFSVRNIVYYIETQEFTILKLMYCQDMLSFILVPKNSSLCKQGLLKSS